MKNLFFILSFLAISTFAKAGNGMVSTQNIHKSIAKQTKAKHFKNVTIIKISEDAYIFCASAQDDNGNVHSICMGAATQADGQNLINKWLDQFYT